jgi:hypothetical protein
MHSRQQTLEWKNRYRIRAGIEATSSELKRSHGIGRLRVRRAVKVCFAVACKIIACNIKRWAKARPLSTRPLHGFLSLLWAHLKTLQADSIKILARMILIRSTQF